MGSVVMMYILPMMLGQTFDMGKLKPGIPIFQDEETTQSMALQRYFTQYQYKRITNAAHARKFVDIGGKLALKIKAGFLDVAGEGSYLKDSSYLENRLEILIKVHFETRTMTLPSSVYPKANLTQFDRNILGTHFCRSITYGGVLIASVRITATNSLDLEKIKGMIDAPMKGKGGAFSDDIKERLDKLKEEVPSSSIEINYYANMPLEGVSYDIDGLMKVLDTFPERVEELNNGLGNPLQMELYPLTFLMKDYPMYTESRTMNELLSDMEDQFDDLRTTKKELGKWLSDLPPVLDAETQRKINNFSDIVNSIYGVYMKTIEQLDTSDGASTKPIENAIDAYRHNGYVVYMKYIRKLYKLRRDIYAKHPELRPKIGGAFYTHWGGRDCYSNDSELVMTGVVTASENSQNGGSSDYICSPLKPNLQDAVAYFPSYDAEKDEADGRDILLSPLKYVGKIANFSDVSYISCAQCRIDYRSSVLIQPANRTCPKGYVKEYEGILMAPGYKDVPKGSYICVDKKMQSPDGEPSFKELYESTSASIQEVTVNCNSLQCPPYVENQPIPCVVCTI